ncbi:MAG: TraR/DksA C4-type zinc finger protein [Proteobacteria bacterium]|nr:formylmethanofuran dehydrogenase [Desulfobacula sp.]MBU4132192.1 TraR/DksA C4-type zinc finger protein [Pseudomonadota bacterium]
MTCQLDKSVIEQTISFHGHSCPGLAIGIRTAELAIQKLKITPASSIVCVVETDMCAVDGIQFLTGCTFGKGNLVHKDFGKAGFTFFDREAGQGFRAVFLEDAIRDLPDPGGLSGKEARTFHIMAADINDLFDIQAIVHPPVRPARILQSITCQDCREKVMESRLRRFDGKDLCIPCFMAYEQKI